MTITANTSTAAAPFGFAGEAFLAETLPNYPMERPRLSVLLVGAVVGWIVVVPYLLGRLLIRTSKSTSNDEHVSSSGSHESRKKSKRNGKKESSQQSAVDETSTSTLFLLIQVFSGIMCLSSVCYLVWMSSNNSYASRAVFEAPLLTPEECRQILDFSLHAANENVQRAASTNDTDLLREPAGWQKTRHTSYQTTDLNLVTDPFTPEARDYLSDKLDKRLAPLLERIFGVTPNAIRANDMFVVRYDDQERTFLAKHTDDSDISINILLSDDFDGGGTRFWHRVNNRPFAHVKPARGHVVTHSALILHEGMPITRGVRHILVGFLAVDHVDPFTAEPTGLNWFASWLSLPFLHVKFADARKASRRRRRRNDLPEAQLKWTDNKYVQSLFNDLMSYIEHVGDWLAPHIHVNLLKSSDDARDYLKSMDDTFEAKRDDSPKATWFRGQQLDRDVNGILTEKWPTRAGHEDSFQDL